jgi:hypothetical protein
MKLETEGEVVASRKFTLLRDGKGPKDIPIKRTTSIAHTNSRGSAEKS